MGLTELIFNINYFKRQVVVILKRHCYNSNGRYWIFLNFSSNHMEGKITKI